MKIGVATVVVDMPLGTWLRCGLCATFWDRYKKGYQLTVTELLADGSYRVKYDCPKCHSWLIGEVTPRPESVPEDYIPVDCGNPKCPNIVWVPDTSDLDLGKTKLASICSVECAIPAAQAL